MADVRPSLISTDCPLLLSADSHVRDEVRRIAAATGVQLSVRDSVAALRAEWVAARLVIVGDDVVGELSVLQMPRRPGVIVVGLRADSSSLWRAAVAIGAERVAFLPADDGWLADRFADCVEDRGTRGAVLCSVGGRGGAGASTFAATLALRAADRGAAVMLIDADPLGGGIDLIVGCEDVGGARWPTLLGTRGRMDAQALSLALPRLGSLAVLACDRGGSAEITADAMIAVLAAARRACDVVVVDLPRAVSPASTEALSRSTRTFLIVPAEVRATASASRVCAGVRLFAGEVVAVVRGPAPSGLAAEVVADALGLPLGGYLRPEPGIARALESGVAPGRGRRSPLARLADRLIDDVIAIEAVA